ncbi:IQ domain-containing protein K isoform X2 [Lagenorhynchus albirostris]|uniref:IQ domain-containing protein K isoform X2 n=1 Tax=Lagenorhynchus albirostris TaxID=27610 RepID=UPI0028E52888|nr:IQ domain-containing protein K isoform X2 [Lagenorhynchus albirostris]
MAAPGQVSGVSQRLERALSTESCITARTPGPVVSPVSLDLRVSPGQVAELPGKNLWEQICEEYEAELPPFPEGYKVKQEAVVTASPSEERVLYGFNTEHLYPAAPLAVVPQVSCPEAKRETIDPKTCSPKEYLETFIFPVLLPGMASLLHQAKKEKCFERKRTKFIACDFLTEWLYNPRPAIPLSLLLTESAAALCIQSFWRAYLVRCDPEIQELRQWQKKLREDKHIRQRVEIFWAKQEQKGEETVSEVKSLGFGQQLLKSRAEDIYDLPQHHTALLFSHPSFPPVHEWVGCGRGLESMLSEVQCRKEGHTIKSNEGLIHARTWTNLEN